MLFRRDLAIFVGKTHECLSPPPMDSMFDKLLQLPLFQGLTLDDLTAILGKVQFHFAKHKAGSILAHAGEPCLRLLFIIKGKVEMITSSVSIPFQLKEYFPSPLLLEPHSIFGRDTTYRSTYRAVDEVHTLSIDKTQVISVLFGYPIFVLNFLNIVSHRAQVASIDPWSVTGGDVDSRIRSFMLSRIERPVGEKRLKIRMEDLAKVIGTTRINISRALNAMQDAGLVELHRGEVVITRAELLL